MYRSTDHLLAYTDQCRQRKIIECVVESKLLRCAGYSM